MPTHPHFAAYVQEQIMHSGEIRIKKMFGEYGVYCNDVFVGLICDNLFFVKITDAGRLFAGEIQVGLPYPNAKPHFLIEDGLEDWEWLSELIKITASSLALLKSKKD
jgi:TfoX/Sxy family transcriptional regulator of competence genes